jgi:LysR family transcriptional regulator, nitrogen assimilation regulatory protein
MEAARLQTPGLAAKSLLGLDGRPLELRELRCFLSVARTGNIGRAARELNVGQPAVSHQMQKLEAGLGMQLLVRHGRGVALTEAGTCLRDRIDQVLQLLASPLETTGEPVAQPGNVVLAVPAELGPFLVLPLIEQFRARYPETTLDIQDGGNASLEEWLRIRRADVAVLQNPAASDDLDICPVLNETLGLVVSPASALADDHGPLKLKDLAQLPLIIPHQQHWIRRRLEQAAFQAGIKLGIALQIDSPILAKALVRQDMGCAVLPATAVRDELARGTLVFRPITRPSIAVTHAVAHRSGATEPVAALAHLLHAAMVSLGESGTWPGAQVIPARASSSHSKGYSDESLNDGGGMI